MIRSRLRASIVLLALAMTGCRPTVLFVGDPALKASLADVRSFSRSLESGVDNAGYRALVVWPDVDELDAVDLGSTLSSHEAPIVILSPYLSLLAPEIAPDFPDTRFIAYYGKSSVANVHWVDYDARAAMHEAGRALASWTFDAAGREAFALVSRNERRLSDEAGAFLAGYQEEGGIALDTVEFSTAPTRDQLRTTIDSLLSDRVQAAAILLGAQSGIAFDLLRSEQTFLAVRDATPGGSPARVIIAVQDDLVAGAVASLRAPDEPIVIVPSSLEGAGAVRK